MAIALVEIRTYTLAEIEEKTATHKARIEVWRPEGFKSNFLKISFNLGESQPKQYIYQAGDKGFLKRQHGILLISPNISEPCLNQLWKPQSLVR